MDREVLMALDRSISTVRYWIARHGLERPIEVRRRSRDAALAHGERTLSRLCHRHGRTTFMIEVSGRVRCRQCRIDASQSGAGAPRPSWSPKQAGSASYAAITVARRRSSSITSIRAASRSLCPCAA